MISGMPNMDKLGFKRLGSMSPDFKRGWGVGVERFSGLVSGGSEHAGT